jgi:ABC-type multidrug transport system fused ATPase/permease subunit
MKVFKTLRQKYRDSINVVRLTLSLCAVRRSVFYVLLVFTLVLGLAEGLTLSSILPIADRMFTSGGTSSSAFIATVIRWYRSLPLPQSEIIGILIVVGSKLFESSLYFLYYYIVGYYMKEILHAYRTRMFANVVDLRMEYFNSSRIGNIIQLISVETSRSRKAAVHLLESTRSAFIAAVYTTLLLLISPVLSLILILLGIFVFFLDYYVIRGTMILGRLALTSRLEITSFLQEHLSGIRETKLFNLKERFNRSFSDISENAAELERKSLVLGLIQTPMFQLLSFVVVGLIFGAYLVNLAGIAAVGIAGVLVFTLVSHELVNSLTGFYNNWTTLNDLVISVPKLNELFTADPSALESSGTLKPHGFLAREIRYDRVSLDYETRPGVLHDISLTIKKGQRVAFVGESGSGKTSILALLLRLFDPSSGTISIDGVDIRQLDLGYLRSHIGVVPQDIYLFNESIRANLLLANPQSTDDEIRSAASRAFADTFIRAMPAGYSTLVGERGTRLSGGQKQRIAIAQVFLKDPEVIIFDEATSSVDAESEYIIQKEIEQIGANKTVMIVAHRLSTVKNVDVIYVIKDGRIVESGHWAELVSNRSYFNQMIDAQMIAIG